MAKYNGQVMGALMCMVNVVLITTRGKGVGERNVLFKCPFYLIAASET